MQDWVKDTCVLNDIWIHLVVVKCGELLGYAGLEKSIRPNRHQRIQWAHRRASTLLAGISTFWEQLSTDQPSMSLVCSDETSTSEMQWNTLNFWSKRSFQEGTLWEVGTADVSWLDFDNRCVQFCYHIMLSFEEMVAANLGSVGWCRAASMSRQVRWSCAGRGCVGTWAKVWAEPQGAAETLQDAQTTKSTMFFFNVFFPSCFQLF